MFSIPSWILCALQVKLIGQQIRRHQSVRSELGTTTWHESDWLISDVYLVSS